MGHKLRTYRQSVTGLYMGNTVTQPWLANITNLVTIIGGVSYSVNKLWKKWRQESEGVHTVVGTLQTALQTLQGLVTLLKGIQERSDCVTTQLQSLRDMQEINLLETVDLSDFQKDVSSILSLVTSRPLVSPQHAIEEPKVKNEDSGDEKLPLKKDFFETLDADFPLNIIKEEAEEKAMDIDKKNETEDHVKEVTSDWDADDDKTDSEEEFESELTTVENDITDTKEEVFDQFTSQQVKEDPEDTLDGEEADLKSIDLMEKTEEVVRRVELRFLEGQWVETETD